MSSCIDHPASRGTRCELRAGGVDRLARGAPCREAFSRSPCPWLGNWLEYAPPWRPAPAQLPRCCAASPLLGHSVLEGPASKLLEGRKHDSIFSASSSSSELSSSPRGRWKTQHFFDFFRHKSSLSTTSSAQRTTDRRRLSLRVMCVGAAASVCAATTVVTVTTVVEAPSVVAVPTIAQFALKVTSWREIRKEHPASEHSPDKND